VENDELTTKQKAAIAALIAGSSYGEAATAASVHSNQITRWMREPAFLAALRAAEGEKLQAVTRSLVTLADKAADALKGVLDDSTARSSSKIRAADVILSHLINLRELVDLEERIRKLEDMQNVK
jgi:hypothetical protein